MAPLTEKRKQEIRTAIRADRKPARGGSNRTILATGAGKNRRRNKYVVLADGAGKLTPAGTFTTRRLVQRGPAQHSTNIRSSSAGEATTTSAREIAGRHSCAAYAQMGPLS